MRTSTSIFLLPHFLVFVLTSVLFSMNAACNENTGEIDISVVATLNVEDDYKVKFILRNLTKETLTFYEGSLDRYNITLILIQEGSHGKILDELVFIDDPSPGFIIIGPGDNYSSTINLDKIFPSLRSELTERNVILFWSTDISAVENTVYPSRFGGYLVIPKSTQQ